MNTNMSGDEQIKALQKQLAEMLKGDNDEFLKAVAASRKRREQTGRG